MSDYDPFDVNFDGKVDHIDYEIMDYELNETENNTHSGGRIHTSNSDKNGCAAAFWGVLLGIIYFFSPILLSSVIYREGFEEMFFSESGAFFWLTVADVFWIAVGVLKLVTKNDSAEKVISCLKLIILFLTEAGVVHLLLSKCDFDSTDSSEQFTSIFLLAIAAFIVGFTIYTLYNSYKK